MDDELMRLLDEAEAAEQGGVPGGDGPSADEEGAPEAQPEPDGQAEPAPEPVPEAPARTFSQDQVNELVGRARKEGRESAMRGVLDQYGLDDEGALQGLIGDGQRFGQMREEYDAQGGELASLKEELALLKAGVPEGKRNDVRAIMAYANQPVTEEGIRAQMAQHPERSGQAQAPQAAQPVPQQPQAQIQRLGGEPAPQAGGESEEEEAMRLFGFGR